MLGRPLEPASRSDGDCWPCGERQTRSHSHFLRAPACLLTSAGPRPAPSPPPQLQTDVFNAFENFSQRRFRLSAEGRKETTPVAEGGLSHGARRWVDEQLIAETPLQGQHPSGVALLFDFSQFEMTCDRADQAGGRFYSSKSSRTN